MYHTYVLCMCMIHVYYTYLTLSDVHTIYYVCIATKVNNIFINDYIV